MGNRSQSKTNKIRNLDDEASRLGIGGNTSPEINEKSYKERMQKRKEIQSKRLEQRNLEKGLVIVFTGNGKGKTTASLGMALRTLGHNKKVVIIQFIKGAWSTGEQKALEIFAKKIKWHSLGAGFTWETQNRNEDQILVEKAWSLAKNYIKDKSYKLVILDEINIAIKLGYIKSEEIIEYLRNLNSYDDYCHVVLTGRGASKEIIEFADLVTEMKLIKHPFKDQGIKAQECIEY
tara:strand:- start:40 stop:741 length:702 start_codon:yes stop_codon:yes gene_type:complete